MKNIAALMMYHNSGKDERGQRDERRGGKSPPVCLSCLFLFRCVREERRRMHFERKGKETGEKVI